MRVNVETTFALAIQVDDDNECSNGHLKTKRCNVQFIKFTRDEKRNYYVYYLDDNTASVNLDRDHDQVIEAVSLPKKYT